LNASEQQQKALGFIREKVLNVFGSTGVQQVIDRTVRDVLGVVVAYPVEDEGKLSDKKGNVLPDAFLMPRGATALDLAFRVHTDVGKAFKGAIDCRTGKRVGKEHLLREGDVLKILV
jgi:ribosome-binding ATPase YchF (GTP1/OBG family)